MQIRSSGKKGSTSIATNGILPFSLKTAEYLLTFSRSNSQYNSFFPSFLPIKKQVSEPRKVAPALTANDTQGPYTYAPANIRTAAGTGRITTDKYVSTKKQTTPHSPEARISARTADKSFILEIIPYFSAGIYSSNAVALATKISFDSLYLVFWFGSNADKPLADSRQAELSAISTASLPAFCRKENTNKKTATAHAETAQSAAVFAPALESEVLRFFSGLFTLLLYSFALFLCFCGFSVTRIGLCALSFYAFAEFSEAFLISPRAT